VDDHAELRCGKLAIRLTVAWIKQQSIEKGVAVSIFKRSKTETIDVHASRAEKQRLQDAARSCNKTVSEFLLDAGVAAANKALSARPQFVLNGEQQEVFQKALERPVKAKPRPKQVSRESDDDVE
jgi:uncharacterized protein (DUF1778 family)